MRYEKEFQKIEEDEERLEDLVSEFKDICNCLEKSLDESRKSELYTDLIQLILRISDYMLRSNKKVKERIDETMGGKVLELESERLLKKGRYEGRQEGRREGRQEGRREGGEIKLFELIKKKLAKGKDIDTIADELEESVEEVKRLMDKLN
jgi:predicted transposase YdaD